jgi:cytidylate kinase
MTKNSSFAYRNITISGLPGAGSTTLLKMLQEFLGKEWQGFSGGAFMRAYAAEKGLFDDNNKLHHSSLVYGEEFDREVDMGMREKLKTEDKWILESWLSGFMAQKVPGVLKVLLECSSEAVRIDRVVNRDGVTVEVAKKHINDRSEDNLGKWSRIYKDEWQRWVVKPGKVSPDEPIDFWRPDIYDVVIDTYSTNAEQTRDKVLDALKKKT